MVALIFDNRSATICSPRPAERFITNTPAAPASGGGQHLYAMAVGEYPLACAVEGTQDVEQRFVIAKILGRPSARQKDRGVVLDANLLEREIGLQAIPAAFDLGVPAGLEIVHDQVQPAAGWGGHSGLPSSFLETEDGVEGLVRLAAVAGDDEDFWHASNLTLLPRQLPQKGLLQSPRHCVILSDSMDIITGNVGWIEVICGPMFSGKSEELIRRLRRAMIARKRVEVFKPTIDNRYSDNEIEKRAPALFERKGGSRRGRGSGDIFKVPLPRATSQR